MMKISLGCGLEIEQSVEWINVDSLPLPGVDMVQDCGQFPYLFDDNSAEYIKAKDLIEHLPNFTADGRPMIIAFIEECHRILKPDGLLWIQTPSWDADFLWIDPTHVRGFDVRTFDFFDPETDFGRSTGFYSKAKFKVEATKTENRNLQISMRKIA